MIVPLTLNLLPRQASPRALPLHACWACHLIAPYPPTPCRAPPAAPPPATPPPLPPRPPCRPAPQESSWDKPPGFRGDVAAVSEDPVPVDSAAVGDTEWHEVVCQDGRVYYYHPDTEVGGWGLRGGGGGNRGKAA